MIRLPEVLPIGDGTQDTLIVKVKTDEGITGIGEVHTSPWVAKAVIEAPMSHVNARGLRDIVVGQDPLNIAPLWDRMYALSMVYGRRGVVIHAMSAIDMALWDILGKAADMPIYTLLGGCYRSEIEPYASMLNMDSQADTIDEVRRLVDEGFRAIKIGWGNFGRNTTSDLRFIARVREAAGPDTALMIDIGTGMQLSNAIQLAKGLVDIGIYFLEEPLSPDDLAGYARLCEASPVPIATGEKENTRFGFRDLMERGHLPIIQPDIARVGGFTEARRIADMAAIRGVSVIPHCWSTDILVAATLHFIASLQSCPYLEFCVVDNPIRQNVTTSPITVKDSVVKVPQTAGLGIELNEQVLAQLRYA